MAGASTNRFGGNALMLGGFLFTIAIFLHPDISSLERAGAASLGLWNFVHWAYLFGDVLLIAGLLMLFRHLAASGTGASEGWAAVALAGGFTGFALDVATTGIHLFSFPPVLPASTPNLANIFDAAYAANNGIGGGGLFVADVALVALGMALKKDGWSAAVVYVAMAVGALELLLSAYSSMTGNWLVPAGMASLVVSALMPLGYSFVGFSFAQRGAK